MMDQKFFRSLLLLVNNKDIFRLLQEYGEERTQTLLNQMSLEKDMDKVKRIQGSVAELRRIKTLREQVIKGAE